MSGVSLGEVDQALIARCDRCRVLPVEKDGRFPGEVDGRLSLEEFHGVGDEMKLGVRAGANSLSELEGKIAAILVETDVLNRRQAFSLVHHSTFEEHELVVDLPVPGHAVVGIEIADNVERRVPGLINSQGEINGLDPVQLGLGKMNPEGLIWAVEANDVIAVRNQIGLFFTLEAQVRNKEPKRVDFEFARASGIVVARIIENEMVALGDSLEDEGYAPWPGKQQSSYGVGTKPDGRNES